MSDKEQNISDEKRRLKQLLEKREAADELVKRGKQHSAYGQYEEAKQCYVNALMKNPSHPEAQRLLKELPEVKSVPTPVSEASRPEPIQQLQTAPQTFTTQQTHTYKETKHGKSFGERGKEKRL